MEYFSAYLGSQWATRRSKFTRVTNMSHSKRISCTEGGGSAMASATMPSSGGCDLRVCEKVYCGRSLHSSSTTCKEEQQVEKRRRIRAGRMSRERQSLRAKQEHEQRQSTAARGRGVFRSEQRRVGVNRREQERERD